MTAPEDPNGLREALARADQDDIVGLLEEVAQAMVNRGLHSAAGPARRAARNITALRAERDAARRERLPHMCRDDHPEIRHAVSDDDERCPVCRERDRASAAEAERDAAAKRNAEEFALRSEAPGDPWDMVRHLEEQCLIVVRERDEWKAVADRELGLLRAAEAEAADLRATNRDLHRRAQKAESFRERHRGGIAYLTKRRIEDRRARRAAEAENTRLKAGMEAKDRANDRLTEMVEKLVLNATVGRVPLAIISAANHLLATLSQEQPHG